MQFDAKEWQRSKVPANVCKQLTRREQVSGLHLLLNYKNDLK